MSAFSESGDQDFTSSNYAYGSSGATGQFDIKQFLKKPQVICRLLILLFAVIVAGCIGSQGFESGECNFNGSTSTCNFGIFLGVITCLIVGVFVVLDFMFDNMSNILHRKYVVISDILISGLMTFLWFSCFCNLVDKWRNTNPKSFGNNTSGMQAVIAFTFFSTTTFGILTFFAVKRYKGGVSQGLDQNPYAPDPFSNPDSFSP